MRPIVVATLYKFARLEDLEQLKEALYATMLDHGVRGTILLAAEGVNGTIAGSRYGVDAVLAFLRSSPTLSGLEHKESAAEEMPFRRTKVRLKKEIVSLGVEGIDPTSLVGEYVSPAEWNRLISDPEVTLIDTRNDYEVRIGTFERAENPETRSFRDFPDYVSQHLDPSVHKKVAMFCTGGIRCEKATSLLRSRGFEQVYHLEGGILKYLEEIPEDESLWRGECFVFDDRVTVDHALEKGTYDLCHACRMPLDATDKESPLYEEGSSCPYCYDERSDEDRSRYQQREKQMKLAERAGRAHLGPEARPEA